MLRRHPRTRQAQFRMLRYLEISIYLSMCTRDSLSCTLLCASIIRDNHANPRSSSYMHVITLGKQDVVLIGSSTVHWITFSVCLLISLPLLFVLTTSPSVLESAQAQLTLRHILPASIRRLRTDKVEEYILLSSAALSGSDDLR
jgi:hypothetical protein